MESRADLQGVLASAADRLVICGDAYKLGRKFPLPRNTILKLLQNVTEDTLSETARLVMLYELHGKSSAIYPSDFSRLTNLVRTCAHSLDAQQLLNLAWLFMHLHDDDAFDVVSRAVQRKMETFSPAMLGLYVVAANHLLATVHEHKDFLEKLLGCLRGKWRQLNVSHACQVAKLIEVSHVLPRKVKSRTLVSVLNAFADNANHADKLSIGKALLCLSKLPPQCNCATILPVAVEWLLEALHQTRVDPLLVARVTWLISRHGTRTFIRQLKPLIPWIWNTCAYKHSSTTLLFFTSSFGHFPPDMIDQALMSAMQPEVVSAFSEPIRRFLLCETIYAYVCHLPLDSPQLWTIVDAGERKMCTSFGEVHFDKTLSVVVECLEHGVFLEKVFNQLVVESSQSLPSVANGASLANLHRLVSLLSQHAHHSSRLSLVVQCVEVYLANCTAVGESNMCSMVAAVAASTKGSYRISSRLILRMLATLESQVARMEGFDLIALYTSVLCLLQFPLEESEKERYALWHSVLEERLLTLLNTDGDLAFALHMLSALGTSCDQTEYRPLVVPSLKVVARQIPTLTISDVATVIADFLMPAGFRYAPIAHHFCNALEDPERRASLRWSSPHQIPAVARFCLICDVSSPALVAVLTDAKLRLDSDLRERVNYMLILLRKLARTQNLPQQKPIGLL